jgi:hypothetical protein
MRRSVPIVLAFLALNVVAPATMAADAVTMTARPLVGGHVRVGAWSAIEVDMANDGPAIAGELRVGGAEASSSSYAAVVDLPTGSRKRYVLYAQPSIFGRGIGVTLVADGATLATASVPVTVHDAYQSVIGVVAEEPGPIVAALNAALADPRVAPLAVVSLTPADLPARVEAWSAIDRLVWQDVDATKLTPDQLDALRTWLGLGGRLVIVGGSTGATTLGSLPDDVLPFRPTGTVDASPEEVTALLGGAVNVERSVPALAGTLLAGTVMGRSGDAIIAAERSIGQGRTTIIGVDPTTDGIAGTPAAQALWRRAMPLATSAVINPLVLPDDSGIVGALNNLPAVGLPPLEQLAALLVAYIALVGPVNYLVLRRLDRREWAWITMPLLIVIFSVGAFGLGRALKGSDTIVNTIAIVRGAVGAESGLGQVYIGVYSPSRRTFDVSVGGGALLSNPISVQQQGVGGAPLDILLGDPAQVRGYTVAFGALRGFRAETALPVPRIESELTLSEGRLQGSVTNSSEAPFEDVAVIYGGSLAKLGELTPGASARIDLQLGTGQAFGAGISDRMFGGYTGGTSDRDRTIATRRVVVEQLTQYNGRFSTLIGASAGQAPAIVGWQAGSPLTVEIGDEKVARVGDAVYLMPLGVDIGGRTTFPDELISHAVVGTDAVEAFDQGSAYSLSRGSMIVDFAPVPFDGAFVPDRLSLVMTPGDPNFRFGAAATARPLPDDEQPAQDDPVGEDASVFPPDGMPELQLFDRTTSRWLEFEHLSPGRAISIAEPGRYVDAAGHFLIRFVDRQPANSGSLYFTVASELEGSLP